MMKAHFENVPTGVRVIALSIIWLILISFLHGRLNGEIAHERARIRMGYMPVITNLAAPVIDHASRQSDLEFESIKFPSFAEMAEAFRAGHIEVAFIIAPLAIVMRQQGVPLKIVCIGNRHESTLVVRSESSIRSMRDLVGKTVAVPIRFSGHFLALKRYFREAGYGDSAVRLVEIPPPDMPSALSSGGIDGYFVGEPFASRSIQSGVGRRLMDVESIWPGFICNVMIVREDLIQAHPDRVRRLVSAAIRSGVWAQTHQDEAIDLVAGYWGQTTELVRFTFTNPPNRFRFDLPVPSLQELHVIAMEMRKSGLLAEDMDVSEVFDDRFAAEAIGQDSPSVPDLLAICRQERS
jgi:NitT/TauT family transport system substrate-binding protein